MTRDHSVRILYVGWTGFGNLGDDVCRDLFIDHMRRALPAERGELEVRTVTHQGISEQALLEFRPSLVVLGAGSLFTLPYLQPLVLALKHGIPAATWGTGFDKLSARALELVASSVRGASGESGAPFTPHGPDAPSGTAVSGETAAPAAAGLWDTSHETPEAWSPETFRGLDAARPPDSTGEPDESLPPGAGAPAAPSGPLSIWQDERVAEVFRRTVDGCRWAGVRGPHTFKILESAGCASPPLHVCGDPGLLLQAPAMPGPVEPWLKEWIDDKSPFVAVNWGTANNNVFGGNEGAVAEALARAIESLVRGGYRVLFFAVWGPDLSPVRRLAATFHGDPGVAVLGRVPPGPQLAWILRHARFSINFKLHANVFSAAVDCPFISLAYRSKCCDFAASMACDDLVVRFDRPDLAEAVLRTAHLVERNHKGIKERLRYHRRRYTQRLEALVKHMAALSEGG